MHIAIMNFELKSTRSRVNFVKIEVLDTYALKECGKINFS